VNGGYVPTFLARANSIVFSPRSHHQPFDLIDIQSPCKSVSIRLALKLASDCVDALLEAAGICLSSTRPSHKVTNRIDEMSKEILKLAQMLRPMKAVDEHRLWRNRGGGGKSGGISLIS